MEPSRYDGSELVFVEVKTRRRTALGTPEESVTATKAKRLIATAQDYPQENDLEQAPWRIGVVRIHLDNSGKLLEVNHIQIAVGEEG
ncbi:MAG: YraN family protein [Dehalococcoidia bacterium]|nr:YraN family protein [Dehalococcoidia bacterium]MDE0824234.1 YraN family protein [Dehalococcoidia bacterium]